LGFQLRGFQRVKIHFLAFRQFAKTLFAHVFSCWWPPQERRNVAESRGWVSCAVPAHDVIV
jgi:hypothetical protein